MDPARVMRHRDARGIVYEDPHRGQRDGLERDISAEVPGKQRVVVLYMKRIKLQVKVTAQKERHTINADVK